jgi:acyl CoA:acetate/3-ketoacid CoA transferase alpha subunit
MRQRQMMARELEVDFVPQGTLIERIRAGGHGLGGILTQLASSGDTSPKWKAAIHYVSKNPACPSTGEPQPDDHASAASRLPFSTASSMVPTM